MSSITLNPAIPILFVRNVTASAAYFRETLSFATDFLYGTPPYYGSVSRGPARLHLRHVGHPNFASLAATEPSLILATIQVSNVTALHAEFAKAGAAIAQPPTRQAWGGIDLHIQDPDGNVISFVEFPP